MGIMHTSVQKIDINILLPGVLGIVLLIVIISYVLLVLIHDGRNKFKKLLMNCDSENDEDLNGLTEPIDG